MVQKEFGFPDGGESFMLKRWPREVWGLSPRLSLRVTRSFLEGLAVQRACSGEFGASWRVGPRVVMS